jgi:hypothetical protein
MHDDRELPMNPDDANDTVDDGGDDLLIRRAARELKAPVAFAADFDARVMAAVRAAAADDAVERRLGEQEADVVPFAMPQRAPKRGVRGAWAWVVSPRTLRVSPLAGLAAAAALAFVMVQVSRRQAELPIATTAAQPVAGTRTPVVPVVNADAVSQVQQVQFVLVAPGAKSVALVGDFNDWNSTATPLAAVRAGGVWTITVPLPPGRYTYNFVVDGSRVMPDPAAPKAPADDFGTPASVVTVAGAQT